jgi:hypothetical protein
VERRPTALEVAKSLKGLFATFLVPVLVVLLLLLLLLKNIGSSDLVSTRRARVGAGAERKAGRAIESFRRWWGGRVGLFCYLRAEA